MRDQDSKPANPAYTSGLALADLLMDQALIVPSVHRVLISCSWVRPTRSACLGFKDRNAALRVCRWFNVGGPYVVAGCKVQAEAPVRERDPKKPWAWTVVLTGVPVKASKRDIGATIPKASKPSHIKLGDTNYDIEPAEAAAAVKTMLSQVGRVEQWKTRARNDKTLKVMVWFAHEVYAEKAMFALHRVPLPFWPEGHLSLMPLTEVKYKVSTPIYMAVKAELVTLQKDFRRRDVFLSILDDADSSQHRYLTLVSARIGALVDSKALLERVLFDELVEQEARGPSMGIPKELLAHAQRRRERPTTEPARGTIGW